MKPEIRVIFFVFVFFISSFFSVVGYAEISDDDLRQMAVKQEFLEELSVEQRVRLLTELDHFHDYSAAELGAKYRWGYIPVDRRPPQRLAEWWRSLTPMQRRQQRVEWYEKHMMQIDVDRASSLLGKEIRLIELERKYQDRIVSRPDELEEVDFDVEFEIDRPRREPDEELEAEPEVAVEPQIVDPAPDPDPDPDPEPQPEPDDEPQELRDAVDRKLDRLERELEEQVSVDPDTPSVDPADEVDTPAEPEVDPGGRFYYQRTGDQVESFRRIRPTERDIVELEEIFPEPQFDFKTDEQQEVDSLEEAAPPVRFED